MDTLNEFIQDNNLIRAHGISFITAKDIGQIKSMGYQVEDVLEHLCSNYNALLHGSRIYIADFLRANQDGKIYASNLAGIAIMRAIISNKELTAPGLVYPYCVDEKSPLKISIHGINDKTIGDNGFVYVIKDTRKFENHPKGSWQYISSNRPGVPFTARIEVLRSDFMYPIFDADNRKQIQ